MSLAIPSAHRSRILVTATLTALAATALVPMPATAQFASGIDLGSLNGTTGFRLDGSDASGHAVSSAGDINGDGFDDVLVGNLPATNFYAGTTYVVFGAASGFATALDLTSLDGSNGFRLDSSQGGDKSGFSLAAAGDVNGDGFADILIGTPGFDPGAGLNTGACYVVFGRGPASGGFSSALELSTLSGANGFRLDGIDAGDTSGSSVASAGDVNGDGFDDIVIGAPSADALAGESYVVFGKASGFASSIALGALNGSSGFRLDGIDASDKSGTSVASAGDLNGDGFADLLIGAFGGNPGGDFRAGESYVVFGKASGFGSAIGLSSLDGSTGFRLDGIDILDDSGFSVSTAGDVNGDGFADILIGARGGGADVGESYVVFGTASGFASALDLASLGGSNGFRLDGVDAYDVSGTSVASAGDVNGDGFDDIVIGAWNADPGGDSGAGESYVVFGQAAVFASAIGLGGLDGTTGFRLDGVNAYDNSGQSVASAGDLNDEGFADILVGAPGANSSYVVLGRAPTVAVTRDGSAAGQYISGGSRVDTLNGLDGDDTLEGRGQGDLLNGGSGKDAASYRHAPGKLIANLANPAANTGSAAGDSFVSIENLTGSAFNDTLVGNDVVNVLTGGLGHDSLTGGGGKDIFRFEAAGDSPKGVAKRDRITDFDAGTGGTVVDHVDLSAIDARTGPGNQAFTFIGTAAFSNVKGQLRVEQVGPDVIVSGDVNGNGVADFEIALVNFSNVAGLTAADFIR